MTQAQHTPGPWSFQRVHETGKPIRDYLVCGDVRLNLGAFADTLAALESLTEGISFTGQAATLVVRDIKDRHGAALAAIAKARGKG